jgi:HAD superfamily hydrolase (TIGR01509 family)
MDGRATPEAVVFDCDGLLLDTESRWSVGEIALFARYGRSFGLEEKRVLLGTAATAAAGVLERLLDQPGRGRELVHELVELVATEISHARPLPGARELVGALRGRVPIAVASNSPRRLLDLALGASGLGPFDATLAGDEVAHGKPAPDLYLEACARLGALPSRAAALEDSPTGVAAARAAGLYVIGVPSLAGTELDADLVAPSLTEASVAAALGLAPA